MFLSRFAVVFAQDIKARCLVENGVFGVIDKFIAY